ncbi:hypothetical protein HDK90DRAFT_468058 [Phyllosticta capitalensis]|uniref:Transposase n=1 Tax=Phyllosticta capitalensis TaxID=121624 RepID=A0ABR1YJG1_9PEZI
MASTRQFFGAYFFDEGKCPVLPYETYPVPPINAYEQPHAANMKFVDAITAKWGQSTASDHDDLLQTDQRRRTQLVLHYFRHNCMTPQSVAEYADSGTHPGAPKFALHEKSCAATEKNLQSKMWLLPSDKKPRAEWPFLLKFVRSIVTFFDNIAILRNFRREFIMTGQTPHGELRADKQARRRQQQELEDMFNRLKLELDTVIIGCINALKESGGARCSDPAMRKASFEREMSRLETLKNKIEVTRIPESARIPPNDDIEPAFLVEGVVPPVSPTYDQLTKSKQYDVWFDHFDIDVATTVWWPLHTTIPIAQNYKNGQMGRVMTQIFATACYWSWKNYVRPKLVSQRAHDTCTSAQNFEIPINPAKIHHELRNVVRKHFDDQKAIAEGLAAVIVASPVASKTPRRGAKKRKYQPDSELEEELPPTFTGRRRF